MLEVVSKPIAGPLPPDKNGPVIKVRPAEPPELPSFKNMAETVIGPDAPPLAPDAAAPDIKVQPADAIFATARLNETPKASSRGIASLFIRVLRFGARTVAILSVCALAWAAGAYFSRGHLPADATRLSQAADVPQSPAHDDTADALKQMAGEISALKALVESKSAAPVAGAQNVEPPKTDTTTGPALADLSGRVDKLEADFTAKLSQIGAELATIEQRLPASHSALASHTVLASHEHPLLHRRSEHFHDAFDPVRYPAAPGAPHPLGAN